MGCSNDEETSVSSSENDDLIKSTELNEFEYSSENDIDCSSEEVTINKTRSSTVESITQTKNHPFSEDAYIDIELNQGNDGLEVIGYTNLPDGGTGIISVESTDGSNYNGQSKMEVVDGKIEAEGKFTQNYMPLKGEYIVSITFSVSNVQTPEFESIVGGGYYYIDNELRVPAVGGGYILEKKETVYFE